MPAAEADVRQAVALAGQAVPDDNAIGWYCVDQRDTAKRIMFIDMSYGPDEKGTTTPVAGDVARLLAKLRP